MQNNTFYSVTALCVRDNSHHDASCRCWFCISEHILHTIALSALAVSFFYCTGWSQKKFVCFIGHLMVDQIAKKCNVMCDTIMKHMLLRLMEYWRWPELAIVFVTTEKAKKHKQSDCTSGTPNVDSWLWNQQWPFSIATMLKYINNFY